jgi:hypothetical protein
MVCGGLRAGKGGWQWPIDLFRPAHKPGERQILAPQDGLAASRSQPSETNHSKARSSHVGPAISDWSSPGFKR